jgi:hypothetical protein
LREVWELCTLDNGGDGKGAAQGGGVLLAGDTGERLALRVWLVGLVCWRGFDVAHMGKARGHTEALMIDWENMAGCVVGG